MKLKHQLQAAGMIILITITTSLLITGIHNWIAYERLNHEVAVFKQESEAVNVMQQWTILVKSLENKLQDIELSKLRIEANTNRDSISVISKRVTQTNIDLDKVSHEECKTHIEEIWDVLERIGK